MVKHMWCIAKHLLLACRYLYEVIEYRYDERIDAVRSAICKMADEVLKNEFNIDDDYLLYHISRALRDILSAEIHAIETSPDLHKIIREMRNVILKQLYTRYNHGESSGQ